MLAEKLGEKIPDVIALTGGMGTKKTREILTKIAETPADKPLTLVATGKYIGEGFDEPRLEGERITASYANAHSVAYYMSDDNRAAPYIRSFTELLVINYCDLLFMAYSIDSKNVKQIAEYYDVYITLILKWSDTENLIGQKWP